MENSSISKIVEFLGVSSESLNLIYKSMETEENFKSKYNIVVDNIKMNPDYIEYWITVPEKSELKSDNGFNMEGIYLAKQFKELIIKQIEYLNKEINLSKLRVKIHYTSEEGSKWTAEESNNAKPDIESLEEILKRMESKIKEVKKC